MNSIANDIAQKCDHETYVWTAQNCINMRELDQSEWIDRGGAWLNILWAIQSDEHLVEIG